MKRILLTLALSTGLFSVAPALQARDRDNDSDRRGSSDDFHSDDFRSDVSRLWEWFGRLRDEANDHAGRKTRDRLDDIKSDLRRVNDEIRDGHFKRDRVRDEIGAIRENLRRVSDDLHHR